ncbi:hypothetical protein, partial [Flavobacterium sp. UGB4466]|uniref:hypothetical protein n=1 Tax=Flavobacterium sp. UGB4466 TaxID=2730889 RepID=UPI001ED8C1A8
NGFRSVEKIIQHVQEFRRNDIFIAMVFNPLKKYTTRSRVPKERHIYSNGFQSVEKIIQHVQEFRRNDIFIAMVFNPLKKYTTRSRVPKERHIY